MLFACNAHQDDDQRTHNRRDHRKRRNAPFLIGKETECAAGIAYIMQGKEIFDHGNRRLVFHREINCPLDYLICHHKEQHQKEIQNHKFQTLYGIMFLTFTHIRKTFLFPDTFLRRQY